MTPMKEARNFTVILMPYVFRDTDHYRHFVESDVFKEMMGEVEGAAGIKYLGYLGDRLPPRVIGIAWHRDRHRSRAAEAFVEAAAEVCGRLEPAAAA